MADYTTDRRLINEGDMSGDVTSKWFNLEKFRHLAIHVWTEKGVTTPDHVGSLALEVTSTPNDTDHLVTLPVPVFSITSGAEYADGAEITDLCWQYIRAVYTRSSGGDDDELHVVLTTKG